jgi:outer membrane protein OmpA-like peptidoglycan-associated protein
MKPHPIICAVAGAAAGVGLGTVVADDGNDDNGDDGNEDAAMALLGAAGAGIGYLLCGEREQPDPVAAAPAPAPTPAPAPPPERDTDGDGVFDGKDDCPGTAKGTPVDAKGCPEIPDLTGVNFEFNKAALTEEARAILDSAVATLERNPHVRVEIVGHTDSVGSDSYNQGLSERRANAVQTYLSSKGVAANRMAASARGESEPIATNDTAEGRAKNRRVTLTARPM